MECAPSACPPPAPAPRGPPSLRHACPQTPYQHHSFAHTETKESKHKTVLTDGADGPHREDSVPHTRSLLPGSCPPITIKWKHPEPPGPQAAQCWGSGWEGFGGRPGTGWGGWSPRPPQGAAASWGSPGRDTAQEWRGRSGGCGAVYVPSRSSHSHGLTSPRRPGSTPSAPLGTPQMETGSTWTGRVSAPGVFCLDPFPPKPQNRVP